MRTRPAIFAIVVGFLGSAAAFAQESQPSPQPPDVPVASPAELTIAKRPPAEWLKEFKAADETGRQKLFLEAFEAANFQLVPELVPLLLRWLDDGDPATRLAACMLLRVTDDGEKKSVPALTRRVEDSDLHVRANAAVALLARTQQAEPAIGVLRAIEHDGDLPQRREALDFLVSWARLDPTLIELFLKEAKSEDEELRNKALHAFGGHLDDPMHRDPRGLDALRDALGDPVERIRVSAAWRLLAVGAESDAINSVLAASATSPNADIRHWVLHGLGLVDPAGAHEFLPILVEGLKDPDANNRQMALNSLSTLGQAGVDAPEARDRLIELLEDPDRLTRAYAALVLGHVGADAETVLPALVKHLADPDSQTRFFVNHSLQQAGPEIVRVLPQLIEALANQDGDLRSNVAGLISMAGAAAKPAVPALTARLADPEKNVRVWSAYALRCIGVDALPALSELQKLLAHDLEPKVRVEAARAIAAFGPLAGTAADAVRAACADPDADVRAWSLFALGELKVGSDDILATLREASKESDATIAAEANKSLQKLGASFDAAAISAAPQPKIVGPPVITRFVYEQSAFVLGSPSAAAIVELFDERRSRKLDVERTEIRYRFRFLAKGQAEPATGEGALHVKTDYTPPSSDATAATREPEEKNVLEIRAGTFSLQWFPSAAGVAEFLFTPEQMTFVSVRADQFEDLDLMRFIR